MSIHVALHHQARPTATTGWSTLGAAGRAPAARAALPHADPVLLAARSSRQSHFINWQQDPYGNYLARARVPREDDASFEVEVDLVADMAVINPFDFFLEPDAEKFPFDYEPTLAEELAPYLEHAAGGAAARGACSRASTARADGAPSISWSS